ncbi:50S ribosomal protein L10 [Actinomycetospora aeridis]|uniref:Large ribosomal subunit protein uL10 n=1 Tax=Actinomycetospora aeridis TaxID=3129231 RepID=A0ABU8N793_9PSEU
MAADETRAPAADKVAAVAEIAAEFRDASAMVVTEYRGLSMKQITQLRRSLGSDVNYTVAKNTLVKRAAADAGVEGLDDLLVGPTAIAFVSGEPVDAAKALRDFQKDNKALVVKGGYMEGRALSATEVTQLADLESREVLLGKLAGAMKGNLAKAAGLFNAPASQIARLAAALQDKRAAEGSASTEDAVAAVESADAEAATEAPSEATSEA